MIPALLFAALLQAVPAPRGAGAPLGGPGEHAELVVRGDGDLDRQVPRADELRGLDQAEDRTRQHGGEGDRARHAEDDHEGGHVDRLLARLEGTQDLIARVRELESIRNFLTSNAVTVVIDLFFTIVFFAVMYLYSPMLTLIVLVGCGKSTSSPQRSTCSSRSGASRSVTILRIRSARPGEH